MPRFQTAVLNKYLKQQDSARMATACAVFPAYFHGGKDQHPGSQGQGAASTDRLACSGDRR
jgi:hypothetical protein